MSQFKFWFRPDSGGVRRAIVDASGNGPGPISRHLSTVLNGMQVDLSAFKTDTDTVLKLAAQKAKTRN